MVPILVAHDGEVIDGRVRLAIAQKHGLACPKIVGGRLTEDDRADLRLAVNLYRRHLTQAQVSELIAWELKQRPEESDRRMAAKTAVNHRTVVAIRRKLEATREILRFEKRTSANGKQYPATLKPNVSTDNEVQAKAASRLLGVLGENAPVGRLCMRAIKSLVQQKRLETEAEEENDTDLPTSITIKRAVVTEFDSSPNDG